jgi:hypothetical protein
MSFDCLRAEFCKSPSAELIKLGRHLGIVTKKSKGAEKLARDSALLYRKKKGSILYRKGGPRECHL